MTHDEQRVWLIEQLLAEDAAYRGYEVPADIQEQKDMLRSLMNVRAPKPISQHFLQIQDEYLRQENAASGVTDADALPASPLDERLVLWQGDITALRIDAIVNAANSQMCGCFRPLHGCVDNVIHSKSGIALRLKCYDMMCKQGHDEPTGSAKITPAYNLPCRYILHTVGPIVQGRLTEVHCEQLRSCYRSCLELAGASGVHSIAFCCISTGVFHFPNDRAAQLAVETVRAYLDAHDGIRRVVFNVYQDVDLELYRRILYA